VFSDRWCDVSYRSDVPRSETIRIPQSCPWVGLTHGLGFVGSGWIEIFQFLVGWIGLGRVGSVSYSADGLGWIFCMYF